MIWLEGTEPGTSPNEARALLAGLRARLVPYGLEEVALSSFTGAPLPPGPDDGELDLDAATEAELLVNLRHALHPDVVRRFRRSALVDIDPGLLQIWMSRGEIRVAPHDLFLTTSEAVGRPGGLIPDAGVCWLHTPPPVALDWWPPTPAPPEGAFTTVSHWGTHDEWVCDGEGWYLNDKQGGFAPFLDLPGLTAQPLELALCLSAGQAGEREELRRRGWRVADAHWVAATPEGYQRYIQGSRGELSAAKPSCARLQNAWVSDRTLCYLASGRPAVVAHTGPSRLLPDDGGLVRVRDAAAAARALEAVAADYAHHAALARALAEERFCARDVAGRLLERALA